MASFEPKPKSSLKELGVVILCITVPLGLVAMCWGTVASSLICLIINTHYGKYTYVLDTKIFTKSLFKGLMIVSVVSNPLTTPYILKSSLICLIINTHYTGKLLQVGFLTQMRDLLPSLAYSLSMGAVYILKIRNKLL